MNTEQVRILESLLHSLNATRQRYEELERAQLRVWKAFEDVQAERSKLQLGVSRSTVLGITIGCGVVTAFKSAAQLAAHVARDAERHAAAVAMRRAFASGRSVTARSLRGKLGAETRWLRSQERDIARDLWKDSLPRAVTGGRDLAGDQKSLRSLHDLTFGRGMWTEASDAARETAAKAVEMFRHPSFRGTLDLSLQLLDDFDIEGWATKAVERGGEALELRVTRDGEAFARKFARARTGLHRDQRRIEEQIRDVRQRLDWVRR